MDPPSIAAGATSLTIFAFRAVKAINACVEDIKTADSTLLQLQSEVKALHSGLNSIATTFQSDEIVELFGGPASSQSQTVKLMTSITPVLEDCQSTLKRLDIILHGIEGRPGKSLFWQPIRALKINMKSDHIVFIRQQIRSYSSTMQMTLNMVAM